MDETIDIDADKVKSAEPLYEFSKFCVAHPDLRFWQALAAWTGESLYIGRAYIRDTYFFEGKLK